jgi:hypothetical protein
MDIGTIIKCVLIAALILAGYYVVSRTARVKHREGFSSDSNSSSSSDSSSTAPSSADVPNVIAGKSTNIVTTNMQNMLGLLQISNNRKTYENLIINMDPWTQAKVVASLNALAAQMISDSSNQTSMMAPPSEKTIALMNSINTMTNFQTTVLPAIMKYVNNA